ncbi:MULTISPECIES: methyl-accepting chemotaxis protein [Marinomonas]|uniref:Methyl-accepting chemotaxis protein n=1 Tax=Marinomonas alcarazii TaxID=491949 RepID=A0A318UZS9_9GAMM|nr:MULTISPECIES: HAMP domain-containing methyl-accepting chemotaxis protein [Marinomonas]PYF79515.1 methyl-accepting chemotaxis protein [Marinomonas alcarazii]
MNSIKQKSMLFLSTASLLVMVIIFSSSYMLAKNHFEEALNKQIKGLNNTLSIALQEPIFSYDSSLIERIMSSFMNLPFVDSIKAYDQRDKLLGTAKDDQSTKADSKDLRVDTVNIVWSDNSVIGHLEVTYRMDSNAKLLSSIRNMFLLIGIILILVLQITNWFVLTRYVVNPIKVVANAMAEIAQGGGDLTRRLNIQSKDEVGALAHGFDTFISNLHTLVQKIVNSNNELSHCSQSIKSNANENTKSTEQQLLEIEQVATALNEMSSATQEVARNANETADKTQRCNELALKGNTIVKNTINDIHNLGQEINSTSEKIIELKDQSAQINTVLEVIKGVAEQTNLLALNAAIEAARAGEQGRGFAVVADEVRSLAQRTQDSTTEIEGIINNLQSASEGASKLMQSTSATLQKTIDESSGAITALDDIIQDIVVINDMNAQVATATEEQSSVASEVSDKVLIINNATIVITDNAASIEQLSDQLDSLSSSINSDLSNFKL